MNQIQEMKGGRNLVEKWLAVDNLGIHEQVCYHAQQASEKYLKAVLNEIGAAIKSTHDLKDLYNKVMF